MAGQPDDDQHTIDQYHDHMSAISAVVSRWRNGEISAYTKRRAIAEENRRYYEGARRSPLNGEYISSMPRTDDMEFE